MKYSFVIMIAVLVSPILITIACKKETSCEGCKENNKPPIAIAGPDQVITLPADSVLLDGKHSSDPDGIISSYLWTKISGPASFNIIKPSDSITKVKALVAGTYLFELKVTDNGGLSAKDTMEVTVNNALQTSCPFQKTLIGTIYPYRYAFQTATAGNKIVFAGGFEIDNNVGSLPSTKVNIFDITTQTWSSADLTNHGGHIATIAAGDKIFFAGGAAANGGSSGIASSRVDIYNTTANIWTSTELSEARSGISAVKAGNKILFAGGGTSTKVDIYDLSSSSWSVTDIQHPVYRGTALGNKAIFEAYSSFDIYDASSNSWSTYPISGFYYNMSPAIYGNKMYWAGGYDGGYGGNNFSDVVHIYDVAADNWSYTTMSQPKALMSAIGAGSKIFWGNGFDSIWQRPSPQDDAIRLVDDIEIYDIATGIHSHHFIEQFTYSGAVEKVRDFVIFDSGTNALHIYNLTSNTWTICIEDFGWAPSFFSIGNLIYVIGSVGLQTTSLSVWKLEF
jgi:hypothetical protein